MLTIREGTEFGQATQVHVADDGLMNLTIEGHGSKIVMPMTVAEVERLKTTLSIAESCMRRAGVE
jgi:hypothetical protein